MYRRATAYTLPPTHDNLVLEDSCGSVSIVFMRIIRRTCFDWNFKKSIEKTFFIFEKILVYDFSPDGLPYNYTRIINN